MAIEKVIFTTNITGNLLEIIPSDSVKDNSVYEIRLTGLKELNGNRVLPDTTIKISTKFTPCYNTTASVKSIIETCNTPDDVILYHLREASRYVDYIMGYSYTTVPFEIGQYVKYKAAHECVLRFYVERSSTSGQKGALGDVSFDNQTKLSDISNLLKELKAEAARWMDAVRGYKIEGRCKPLSAIKSSNIINTRPANEAPPPRRSDWS